MNRIHLENNPEWCRINGKLLFFDKDYHQKVDKGEFNC